KNTSMEDGRPRPSRFERWRASKFLSRHPEPRGDSRHRLSGGGAQLRNSFMHCHPARASLRSEGSRRAVRKPRAFARQEAHIRRASNLDSRPELSAQTAEAAFKSTENPA